MVDDVARLRAARSLANGTTQAEAARQAGVDRATITRWKREPAFQDLILKASEPEPEPDTPDEAAKKGLTARVEQALRVIDDALAGKDVSPQMARVALDVIKAAKTFEPQSSGAEEGPSTLTTLIASLDDRDKAARS